MLHDSIDKKKAQEEAEHKNITTFFQRYCCSMLLLGCMAISAKVSC